MLEYYFLIMVTGDLFRMDDSQLSQHKTYGFCIQMIMKIYIPIKTTDVLDSRVEKSLLMQTLPTELILVPNVPLSTCKRKGEFEGRDKIVELVKRQKDEIIVESDADAQQLFADNLQCQLDFLNNNSDVGVVALFWKDGGFTPPYSTHVKMTCTMWRKKVLINMPQLDYEGACYSHCHCMAYKDAVEKQGYKMCYIDPIRRVRHLDL